jgi:hypothetical protein
MTRHKELWTTRMLGTAILLTLCVSSCAGRQVTPPLADAAVIRSPEDAGDCRFLMRFDMPQALSAGRLELAVLEFRAAVLCPDGADGLALEAHPLTTPWQGATVGWVEGWDAPGGDVDAPAHAPWGASVGDSTLIRFDVTDVVEAWTSEVRENYGFLVMRASGEEGRLAPLVAAGDTGLLPVLTVWYTPCHSGEQR